jgi:glycosyltransferase involved in cell wall biosynthesis
MPPKVCVLTSVHPALDVRIFHKECRSLSRAGYPVTLIAPIDQSPNIEGIQLRCFPKYSGRVKRFFKGLPTMYRAAKEEDADVYHFHDPELIPVGLLLRANGKQVIYDVHEDLPKTISYKSYIPKWLKWPLQATLKLFEEWAARFMSGVIAATKPIAARFSKARSVTVVHNYPLLEEFEAVDVNPETDRSKYVAYVGARITRGRGAVEMVQAMGLLPSSLNVQLKLAGAFDPPGLPESLSALPGWERIAYLGVLGRIELARMLQHARAGLVLLHPEPNYLNAQPVKLFEYMGAGIPVIASDFPVWRNVIESAECGLLVDPLDPAAIANAIDYLWSHPAEAAEMGRRGRAAVKARYNWSIEEQHLLRFYGGIAGPEPAVVSAGVGARA